MSFLAINRNIDTSTKYNEYKNLMRNYIGLAQPLLFDMKIELKNEENDFSKLLRKVARGDLHCLTEFGDNTLLKHFLPANDHNYNLIRDMLRGTLYLIANPFTKKCSIDTLNLDYLIKLNTSSLEKYMAKCKKA